MRWSNVRKNPRRISIYRALHPYGSENRIHVDGVCKSACALFLGIRNVCVDRGAELMFHAGHDIAENRTGPDTRASRSALCRYNEACGGISSKATTWIPPRLTRYLAAR
jgi:hypothetical protein